MRSFLHLSLIFWVGLTSIIYVRTLLAINSEEYLDCILEKRLDSQCGRRSVDDQGDEYYCHQIYEGRVNNISSLIYYTEDNCPFVMCKGRLPPKLLSNLTCIFYEQHYILVSNKYYGRLIIQDTIVYILSLLGGITTYSISLKHSN